MSALVISFILIIAFLIEVISIRIIEIPCRHYIEVKLIIVTLVFSTNLIFAQSFAQDWLIIYIIFSRIRATLFFHCCFINIYIKIIM